MFSTKRSSQLSLAQFVNASVSDVMGTRLSSASFKQAKGSPGRETCLNVGHETKKPSVKTTHEILDWLIGRKMA